MLIAVVPKHGGILLAAWREVKFDDAGGLAEIFALAWVFIALVIGEVGLNILRWFTLGFDYAGNGFRPSTGCAGPSCKPRVFLKTEPSARRCHDDSSHRPESITSPWKFTLHHHPHAGLLLKMVRHVTISCK
jgi:hypothetical protein